MYLFITIFKLYCWWERRHSLLIPQKAHCMCHFHIHSSDLVNNFFDFYMASCLYRITRCSMDYYLHIKVEIILLMSLLSFSEEPSFLYSGGNTRKAQIPDSHCFHKRQLTFLWNFYDTTFILSYLPPNL